MNKVIKHVSWPFSCSIRHEQQQTLIHLQNAIDQQKKYLFVQMPTGGGKSYLGPALNQYISDNTPNDEEIHGRCFLITPTKQLQDQYQQTFYQFKNIDCSVLKGTSNYMCDIHSMFDICDPACISCQNQYTKAKEIADASDYIIMNTMIAFYRFYYNKQIKNRQLLVIDEAHNLEQHLIRFGEINITSNMCKKYQIEFYTSITEKQAIQWIIKKLIPAICEHQKQQKQIALQLATKKTDKKKLAKINTIIEKNTKLKQKLSDFIDNDSNRYVFDNSGKNSITWKQKNIADNFNDIIANKANHILIMSATLGNQRQLYQQLEIDPHEAAFIDVDSPINIKRRPIYNISIGNMGQKHQHKTKPKVLDAVNALINSKHKNDNGVIHTSSYALSKWLCNNIKTHHKIFNHNDINDNREYQLIKFTTCKQPSILISPSFTEGLDLPDDAGRFAMFIKVPYMSLGDAWVKYKTKTFSGWYQQNAAIQIIQGSGRVVRHKQDYGSTYIFDSCFNLLLRGTKDNYGQHIDLFPYWFRKALVNLTL